MELRVRDIRQPYLVDHRAEELDVAFGIVTILHHPLRKWTNGQRATTSMRQKRLLRCRAEVWLSLAKQVTGERRLELCATLRCRSWRKHTFATPLARVRATAVDLEIGIRLCAIQHGALCVGVEARWILLHVLLSIWGG
jgi:hypothetical protein